MANASKLLMRQAVAPTVGDYFALTTTSAGNAGGTTVVCTQFSGYGADSYRGWWLLQTSGANGGATPQYRQIIAFDGTTSTFTVTPAFGAQVASGVTMELHQYEPPMFTRACNSALRVGWPSIHLPAQSSSLIVPPSARATISTSSIANPTVITTAAAHGLTTGQTVIITEHTGMLPTTVNGTHTVTVTAATTFTIAINVTTGGTGGYAQPTPYQYALPTGYSPGDRIVSKIQMGGPTGSLFAGIPAITRNDVSYSPDGTLLYFGRTAGGSRGMGFVPGDTIYLFARKYLTALGADTTWGQLATDTTATIEMEQTVPEWDLLLLYTRVEFYRELAMRPGNERRAEHRAMLALAEQELAEREPRLRMRGPEKQDFPW